MIASAPDPRLPAPAAVQRLATGRPVRAVWRNELGGLTFEIGAADERLFAKWQPQGTAIDLDAEAARLTWAAPYTPVPRVLERGADDDGEWLVTAGLPGDTAVADRWKADPRTAVVAIGEGLRAMHDAMPVDGCPFSWSVPDRIATANGRPTLGDAPPIDQLVVCHGDACAPNTLVGDDGRWTGHVDLGALGVADRWADLAVATWSTQWNYGPGWEEPLLAAYGVAADPQRTDFYRRLWDADG